MSDSNKRDDNRTNYYGWGATALGVGAIVTSPFWIAEAAVAGAVIGGVGLLASGVTSFFGKGSGGNEDTAPRNKDTAPRDKDVEIIIKKRDCEEKIEKLKSDINERYFWLYAEAAYMLAVSASKRAGVFVANKHDIIEYLGGAVLSQDFPDRTKKRIDEIENDPGLTLDKAVSSLRAYINKRNGFGSDDNESRLGILDGLLDISLQGADEELANEIKNLWTKLRASLSENETSYDSLSSKMEDDIYKLFCLIFTASAKEIKVKPGLDLIASFKDYLKNEMRISEKLLNNTARYIENIYLVGAPTVVKACEKAEAYPYGSNMFGEFERVLKMPCRNQSEKDAIVTKWHASLSHMKVS